MKKSDIPALLERLGFPFAYDHFAEGEGPEPPFLVYRYPSADNFAADGVAYFKQNVLHIEVYTDSVSAISKCRFSPKWDVDFYRAAYRCYTALYTTSLAGLKPVKP